MEKIKREIMDTFSEDGGERVAKWVETENLHLTLLFIGEVKDEVLPAILQAVEEAARGQENFVVKFQRVCYGPGRAFPPRLIWVEGERNKILADLVERLKKEVLKRGVLKQVEERPFVPHLTLARIKAWQWKQIEPEERPNIDKEIDLGFEVNSVDIMESVLRREGQKYSILQSLNFSDRKN